MKTKVLPLLLAACLIALAAWQVAQNNSLEIDSQNTFAPVAQGAGSNAAEEDRVPEKYRETVDKGLEYLVKSQFQDGYWEGDDGKHPVAMTGLAGLALLMEGTNFQEGKYSANIRKAVDWLMVKCQAGRDGLIYSDHPSETARYMQGHGLATLFLAGACKEERDYLRRQKLTDILIRAVKYIARAQSSQGGWYHTSKVEGHDFDTISATVIQIQALQAADNAGIPVPHEAINDAQEYLKMALGKYEDKATPERKPSRLADTAAALACRFNRLRGVGFNGERKDELRDTWFKYCETEIPAARDIKFGRDELIHYYYAQTFFNFGGDAWSNYRTALFDHLQSSQNQDGSWPAGDGISVGPVYATAVWCTILQLDRHHHPSTRVIQSF